MSTGAAPPRVLGDRYELGTPIGRGGRATVFEGTDLRLGRSVAVKVFSPTAFGSADIAVQEAEARLVSSFNHYALTTLFDAGVDSTPDGPVVYIVMERVLGPDLRRRLHEGGALPPLDAASLGFDIAAGLRYVHGKGYLHRDVKPANVLVVDRPAFEHPGGRLADFGISSIIGIPDPGGFTTGTAAYLSPEQVEGFDPTPASDIYALGLVVLEALTGTVAFPGDRRESALARLARDPDIPPSVPDPLHTLLRRMTALEPDSRPPIDEVVQSLRLASLQDVIGEQHEENAARAEERARLAAVRRYNVLDTPPEDAFDEITGLAARLLRVPIALVSIIDFGRVWFKSRHGLVQPEAVARDAAFCTLTDPGGGPWAISDVLQDDRVQGSRLVTGPPHVRSFAAAPLRSHDGHALGSLCVFDQRPRDFTAEELANLATLAAVIMRELEIRLASRRAVLDR